MKYFTQEHTFFFGLKRLYHNRQGVAFIEMAIALPILLLLLFGTIEISSYILLNKVVQNCASLVGNLVTTLVPAGGPNELTTAQLDNVTYTLQDPLNRWGIDLYSGQPTGHTGQYRLFITDISLIAGTPTVNWTYDSAATTSGVGTGSDLGGSGGTPFAFSPTQSTINPFPSSGAVSASLLAQSLNGFSFTNNGEEIIVASFYYSYNALTSLLSLPGISLTPYYHGVSVYHTRGPGNGTCTTPALTADSIAIPPGTFPPCT